MRWSFSMQPIKFTVTSLIPCRNGSNQSATQFGFWTNFSHGYEDGLTCATRGPSREPYQTISTVYFILGILRTDLWSQGIKIRAYKRERGENCFFAHETQFLLTPSLFASLTFLLFSLPRRHYHIFNEELKHRRRRRQRERQRSNRFRLAEQQLCTRSGFLYISLPSLHDYDVKIPNFTFCGGREHKTTTFFFYSWTSVQS